MKQYRLRFVALVVLGVNSIAFGWGQEGHKIINQSFTIHFPVDTMWFARYTSYYAAHASDADNRKVSKSIYGPADEYPRHFIDIDYYPEFYTSWFPHDIDTLIAKYGSTTVYKNGDLPWAIEYDYDSLVIFLRNNDTLNANRVVADLGHYIGDAHQPLHCTENYNRNGFHSRYETTMINDYQDQISITPDTVLYIDNVLDFAFQVVDSSNSKVQMISDADDSATVAAGGTSSTLYYQIMWSLLGPMTKAQIQDASLSLASLVYSAWVDAGSPDVHALRTDTPEKFSIRGPYPNPFNPSTMIDLTLQQPSLRSALYVYSVTGELVKSGRLNLQKGNNSVVVDMSRLPSGIYFIRLDFVQGQMEKRQVLKAVLLK